jgi:L-threonylcarbamoyladenylate synthase
LHDNKKIVPIDSKNPESSIIAKAGKIIQKNGLVIFPAKCLYGIAANAMETKAIEKVFQAKQRPLDNPILVLIPDTSFLLDLVQSIPKSAKKLMDKFWPGNLTIVFEAKKTIPELLTANTGKIGIRIDSHPVTAALVNHLGFPITGTSANLSGRESCNKTSLLDKKIIDHSDMILDAGRLKGGTGSTIVDVTSSPVEIIRQGEIPVDRINEILVL